MSRFAKFAWVVLAATLLVILWGAYVRASGSGAGCGSHWPTCNGEVIPQPKSVKTIIEFVHRVTSGTSFVLVVAQLVWAFKAFPRGHQVRTGAALSMFFMVTEAGVGAGLVLLEHVAQDQSFARLVWMGTHLVNTFLLVATLALTAYWASGGAPIRLRGQGLVGLASVAALAFTLLLGVTGAITALGDTLFPAKTLIEGAMADVSPTAHFLVRLRVLHPVIGIAVGGYVLFAAGFFGSRRASPSVRKLGFVAGGAFIAQVAIGFVNLALLAPITLQIVHLLSADLVWISLVLLVGATLAEPSSVAQERAPVLSTAA